MTVMQFIFLFIIVIIVGYLAFDSLGYTVGDLSRYYK